jgi:hypothetical protein
VAAFQRVRPIMESVHISLGPSSELRYPSYVEAAGCNYPDIGFIEAYSPVEP